MYRNRTQESFLRGNGKMSDVKIRLRDNGPLLVEGAIKLMDAEDNEFEIDSSKPAIALCRCGTSERKPFCDGSHNRCNFESVERAS